ncbi:MAG: amidohydrolase family protein, partial [Intestinibacillus sp.]
MLLLYHGHILDPYTGIDAPRDLLIGDDGRILEVGQELTPAAVTARFGAEVRTFDASGLTVSPGLVDVHVHFRDPGQTDREDLYTGARAAAAGGYTTVVCMANTAPTVDSVEMLRYVQDKAQKIDFVHILQACAVTKGLDGREMTDFEALHAAGAAAFTDDGVNLSDAGLCRAAMARAAALGALLSFHEEDRTLVPSPGVNYGSAAARRFGVPGARPESEECMIARDIALALRTGAKVSFQHVSSANSVRLIRAG